MLVSLCRVIAAEALFIPDLMKTYVITLSKVFPVTHKRAGEPTDFHEKFAFALSHKEHYWQKLHTIRANYPLWRKRFDEIEAGKAQLSIRQWSGQPYCSKQVELAVLTKEDGIGIQKLQFEPADRDGSQSFNWFNIDGRFGDKRILAHNDGLTLEDWMEWFRRYDLSQPLAVIFFTSFRY